MKHRSLPVTITKAILDGKIRDHQRTVSPIQPQHDSRFEHRSSWIFSEEYLGWTLEPAAPASGSRFLAQAMEFCRWLSEQLGEK